MITSITNKKVKSIVQLNKKAGQRRKEDVFITEGIKMFLEAPVSSIQEIYISDDFRKSLSKRGALTEAERKLERCGYETVTEEVFAKMSDTQTPQGILCVLKQFHYSLQDMMRKKDVPLFLVLEALQDPGNLGTIMRTGEGAGITGIIMSKDTVDIYNPKTIRSTMGSIYRVPFFYADDIVETVKELQKNGTRLYAAHLKGEANYCDCDYKPGTAFLIGNEGNGLSDALAEAADTYIKIPMKGQVESLNAAVSASLLMYEAARQRG
ncbi:MAG: RNA methyltransferase [Clostridiales bacterium]|nr:RNA methyltransferase [Clostridiales bacterium]